MKKLLVSFALFSLFSIPVFAQDVPLAEVFGGYQLLHDVGATEEGIRGSNYHGFTAAFEGKIASFAGIVAEFGFNDHSEENGFADSWKKFSLLFGPRITAYRGEEFQVFGHFLFGGIRSSITDAENTESEWRLGYALGGGIDIVLNKTISVRLAQLDLISEHASADKWTPWSNHFRYSGGVVFKFGSK